MSYIEELRKSRNKPQVAYQEFALHTRRGKDGLFCFFEGKDNAYYVPKIKQFTNNYHTIRCGGRENVLKVYELIKNHREYDKYKKAFFIDRDFNSPLPPHNPPIFETPCYSIENFYVSVEVFQEIIKNEFQLSEVSDQSYNICLNLFIQRQKEFHTSVLLFNAWYACLIEIKNITGEQTGVNLENKLPKGFINFTLESVASNYDVEKIQQTFPNAIEATEERLNQKLAEFSICEYHKVFRGKYEMQFLLTFIELILQDSIKSQRYLKNKIKFTFGEKINNEQAIKIFSAYAETPETLLKYLKEVTITI
ncbi:DUF4435 domain-containing protein [Lyngbya sp. PCC 8106]|uniref:DUF4435 domain-containing protein n=1 Tax=Lyngbya sp. (strain PCC 8106) TaxID=313612 RepID=UPI0000EAC2AC|nr:DUF4435 domain-containing protein [Lyngbya sp. PCC 8106]EAW38384.1 group-specific protein [Lyngbya sp. PCC 8106]